VTIAKAARPIRARRWSVTYGGIYSHPRREANRTIGGAGGEAPARGEAAEHNRATRLTLSVSTSRPSSKWT
jgi:hypothetical protein